MVKANEDWRNDPVRKNAVATQIAKEQAAFRTAFELVSQAIDTLDDTSQTTDPIYRRCREAVGRAHHQMMRDKRFVLNGPTDTYLSNAAALGEAEHLI